MSATLTALHEPDLIQDGKVLRDRGVRESHTSYEISDRCLARGHFLENRSTIRIRDGVEHVGGGGGASHDVIIVNTKMLSRPPSQRRAPS